MTNVFNLNQNLSTSILFVFGCLMFTGLLSVVYFSKEKQNVLRSKIYRVILASVLCVLITEMLYLLCLGYFRYEMVITIVKFIHWLTFIFWTCVYAIYCVVYIQNLEYDNFSELIKNSKNCKALFIISIILFICYFIIPKGVVDIEEVQSISSMADYFVLVGLTSMCTYVLICAFTVYKSYPMRRKVAISLIMMVMLVMLVLQIMFNNVSVYTICCSLQVFFLYFIIENPDIHLAREIENLKLNIDKSNKSKTDFLSNMSHEIRTPMNAIIGFSDSLLNNPNFDEATARNDIQSIATAGTNLVDIINNILDISKIESGNDTLDNKEFNIAQIIKELGSIIEARIGNNPVKLYIELDEQIPSKVYGDSTKIYQILLNITNNAVKYTEVGKIKLSVVPEKVNGDTVLLHFKISDTGYGIKNEDFDKIFEKFSRLDSAVSNEIEGTGLGLVITKKFVDLMGGKIWFTSEFEVGTTFYVDLPLKVIDSTPIGNVIQSSNVERVKNFLDCSDFTALVVDDSKLNLKVAERLLKKYNFNVDTAQSGKDCIYKFKYGNHYDIIFLDHMMPEMDGIETARILKRLDDYDIPPIIAFTANAMNGMEEKYLSEGFDYYLPMPISTQELDKIVHKFFGNKTIMNVSDKDFSKYESMSQAKEKVVTEEVPVEEKVKTKDVPVKEEVETDEVPIKEEVKTEEVPVEEEVKTKDVPVKEEVKTEEAPVDEEVKTEEVPVKEEVKTEEAPVDEEVKPDEVPVKEAVKIEEAPVDEEVKTKDVPVKEEVKTEEAPVNEEVKTEEAPVDEEVETDEVSVKEEVETDEAPVNEDIDVEVATDKSDDAMLSYLKEQGVDVDKSLELLGDMEMYNMTLGDFIDDVSDKWQRINNYKEASDMPNYAIEVHSLKSDCKYLGFMNLADISYQHELKSKENDVTFVNEHFDELVSEYNVVMKLVKTYMTRFEI